MLSDASKFLESFASEFKIIHDELLSKTPLVRIGIVFTAFLNEERSATIVINKFIKDKKISNSKEVSVRYNKEEIFNKINLNVIQDWQSGVQLMTPQGAKTGLLLSIDINTSGQNKISKDFGHKFWNFASEKFVTVTGGLYE